MADQSLKCLLCDKNFSSKYDLTQHIYHHLSYRKYQCTTCTELFYTEEEREIHCKRRGHIHTYEIKISPYCELYVNQLLKDVDFAALHGFDSLIMQRSKANLACDVAMSKLPKSPYGLKRTIDSPSGHEKTPSIPTKTRALLDAKRNSDASSSLDPSHSSALKSKPSPKSKLPKPSDENCEESCAKPTKNARSRERNSPDDWTKIEVDNCPTISSATQLLGEALRTSPAEVRCTICKATTPSDYVIRKQHVSSNHMPKDHTESDYVEILSDMMKKAYPTLTYNDLQCQIGGCHKEYRCTSSRRNHVLRIHYKNELSCPLNCNYRSNDFSLLNLHLKEDHGLQNGYMSIDSQHVREQFNTARAKHNFLLNSLTQRAFPCPIPDCYKTNNKTQTSEFSPGDPVHNVISHLREKSRKFQNAPPNPLRLRSPSSDSDSSSERNEDSEVQAERNDDIAVKTSTVPSPVKTNENRSQLTAQVSASTARASSSSSSDESDRANSATTSVKEGNTGVKASTQPLNNVQSENESATKRKRVASTSSSSSYSSSSLLSTPASPRRNAGKPPQGASSSVKIQAIKAGKQRSSNDQNRAINSSSSSSSSESSGSEGDVRVVKTITNSSKRFPPTKTIHKPVVSRVILDDDDDDEQDEDVTYLTSKAGKKRTLAISGVTVRSPGVRASPTGIVTQSAPPAGVKSRRLAISGVLVPIDKTPLSSSGKTTSNSERRFASDSNVTDNTVQVERRRELARRRFDIAEQRRAERAALNKKRASMPKGDRGVKMGLHNRAGFKKRKKVPVGKSPASGSRRHSEVRDASSEKPSYIVEKVEDESPSSRRMWYSRSP